MTNPPIPPAVVEAMARAIVGPHNPVPPNSPYTLEWLREIRWSKQSEHGDRQYALIQAQAALSAALATGEIVLREDHEDAIRAAFIAGCEAVHNNYQEDRAPDFTEAAYDYAASVSPESSSPLR